jgi:hypothetical protein
MELSLPLQLTMNSATWADGALRLSIPRMASPAHVPHSLHPALNAAIWNRIRNVRKFSAPVQASAIIPRNAKRAGPVPGMITCDRGNLPRCLLLPYGGMEKRNISPLDNDPLNDPCGLGARDPAKPACNAKARPEWVVRFSWSLFHRSFDGSRISSSRTCGSGSVPPK